MRVALLSDTHATPGKVKMVMAQLRPYLQGVDAILHAGDLTAIEMFEVLTAVAPCHAVAGNMDTPDVHARLPEETILELAGRRIGLVHGGGSPGNVPDRVFQRFLGAEHQPTVDVIVFGHTHQPLVEQRGKVLLVNPGSPTDGRSAPYRSLAMLEMDDTLDARIIRL
jgi:putative phosphoesterase